MEKQTYDISIDAPREKVWNVLWNDASYREWTAVFSEGSHAETDWKEGSKILFLDAHKEGMVSTVAANKPNEFMSIKHLGTVKNGVEDLDSEETREWSGSLENYTLETVNGKTKLTVGMDITDDYKDYFKETWPIALQKVKEMSEEK